MIRSFQNTQNSPLVETKYGTLRGFVLDNIYTFHGIPYAYADRFQAPQPPEAWEGVRNATNYGYICPSAGSPAPSSELFIPHRFWPADEHCQYLNVWTPGLDDRKRPVMVWFHGGGYSNGSSIEQVAYEGDALAAYGDVVVVTVNHRLNILGYFDLSSFGEKYANSGNAGIADLVASLQWVHDNIAAFGGDPDNVTIFGQSGGGDKVQSMMQTPAAAGLFHKAIIMSGVLPAKVEKPVPFREIALGMMEKLHIDPANPEALETVPYYFLDHAFQDVCDEMGLSVYWRPVVNDYYKGLPLLNPLCDHAKTIPTMVGGTVAELSIRTALQDNLLTAEKLEAKLREKFGAHAEEVFEAFHKTFPDAGLDLLSSFDVSCRPAYVEFARKKAAQSQAPTYLYDFALQFQLMGGVYAWHCSDIPFVFHNSHRVPCCNIPNVTETLEDQMAGAWVRFAYSGNPNHAGMPAWKPFGENETTMVFDENTRCCPDFDTELIAQIEKAIGKVEFVVSPPLRKLDASGEKKRDWMY